MPLGQYIGAGAGTTKLLLHLNGSSVDSSGNNNNGTDTAITYSQANGKFGQGAGFNPATSSNINISATAFPYGTGSFTNITWIKIGSLPGTNGYSFADFWGKATANQSVGNGLHNNAGTQNIIFANFGSDLEVARTLSTGVWYLLLSTFDGTTYKGYLDGELIASGAKSINITSGTFHHIGAQEAGGGTWNGSVDEVIIENRAWSASEVKKYFTFAKGRFGII